MGGGTDRGPNVGLGESKILEEEKHGLWFFMGFDAMKPGGDREGLGCGDFEVVD